MRLGRSWPILLLALAGAGCSALSPSQGNSPAASPQTQDFQVRQSINHDPAELAALIKKVIDVTVAADPRTGLLILSGKPDNVAMAIDMMNKLEDISDFGTGAPTSRLVARPLIHAQAASLIPLLDRLSQAGYFDPSAGISPPPHPAFAADARLNILYFTCSENDDHHVSNDILALLQELDQPVK